MLFALRKDGVICQWNYLTGKLIQEIETAASKRDARLKQVFQQTTKVSEFRKGFTVKEGYIFLKYGEGRHRIGEVISYASPKKRHLIRDKDVHGVNQVQIKKNKLYIMSRWSVLVWDLLKQKKTHYFDLIEDTNFLCDFTLIKDKIYATPCYPAICILDTKSWKFKARQLPSNANHFLHIEVIGSILFGFSPYNQNGTYSEAGTIWAYDLSTEKEVGAVDNVMNQTTYEIQPEVLQKLLKLCQAGSSSQV